MNANVFNTLRLLAAKWKLIVLSGCLFAGLSAMAGLRAQDSVKSTITIEMAPGNYGSMVEQVTGGKYSDPLLDPSNQFSLLLFLLQDQVSAAEYLSKGGQPASPDQVRGFLRRFAVAADKKNPSRATLVIGGKSDDGRENVVNAWLAFNQEKVMTKVKSVLSRGLDEYAQAIETQITAVRKAGKSSRSQKIAELEASVEQLYPGVAVAGALLEPAVGAPAFDLSRDPGGGVELSAAVTPQSLRNQIALLRNLTPNATELELLDVRRQIASLSMMESYEVPVFRMMGTSTQPGRFSFAILIWMALGAVLGLALATGGLIMISSFRRLIREMKSAERKSVELVRRSPNDEILNHRAMRMEAAE